MTNKLATTPGELASVVPYLVIDDFLSPESHQLLWLYLQVENFLRVDVSAPTGQWPWHDGGALRGPTIGYKSKWHAQFPTGTALDVVIQGIVDSAAKLAPVLGQFRRDWEDFTSFPSLYPVGAGLTWHRDAVTNAGSYVYYAHPHWNVEWGGELLLGDASQLAIPERLGPFFNAAPAGYDDDGATWLNSHLQNDGASEVLLAHGTGTFVMPKPNRLVVLRGGLPHKIAKVSIGAGSNVRASVAGFFKRIVR
jgi:Rps23 Pro-64 3,4-dihydroxylase Tpa1-like proline 4-hydroxylase